MLIYNAWNNHDCLLTNAGSGDGESGKNHESCVPTDCIIPDSHLCIIYEL